MSVLICYSFLDPAVDKHGGTSRAVILRKPYLPFLFSIDRTLHPRQVSS